MPCHTPCCLPADCLRLSPSTLHHLAGLDASPTHLHMLLLPPTYLPSHLSHPPTCSASATYHPSHPLSRSNCFTQAEEEAAAVADPEIKIFVKGQDSQTVEAAIDAILRVANGTVRIFELPPCPSSNG